MENEIKTTIKELKKIKAKKLLYISSSITEEELTILEETFPDSLIKVIDMQSKEKITHPKITILDNDIFSLDTSEKYDMVISYTYKLNLTDYGYNIFYQKVNKILLSFGHFINFEKIDNINEQDIKTILKNNNYTEIKKSPINDEYLLISSIKDEELNVASLIIILIFIIGGIIVILPGSGLSRFTNILRLLLLMFALIGALIAVFASNITKSFSYKDNIEEIDYNKLYKD